MNTRRHADPDHRPVGQPTGHPPTGGIIPQTFEPDDVHIYLFKKPGCPQCDATVRKFKKVLGEERCKALPEVPDDRDERLALEKSLGEAAYAELVIEVDVAENPAALAFVQDTLGYQAAPVTYFQGRKWSGFHPDDTAEVAKEALADQPAVA